MHVKLDGPLRAEGQADNEVVRSTGKNLKKHRDPLTPPSPAHERIRQLGDVDRDPTCFILRDRFIDIRRTGLPRAAAEAAIMNLRMAAGDQ